VKGSLPPPQETDDDAALFRAAVGDVKPLPQQNRIPPQPAPRKPFRHSNSAPDTIADTLSDFAPDETADEYLGNGLSRMTLRKLRRGHWPVQDRLDLHGLNTDAARKLLQEFLHEAVQHGARCVLVVHGKGINSRGGEAVLRKLTRHWLTQHPRVLAWCDAPPQEGGSGAVLVLLKTSA
jgi:DNA-nicking Smr family endonuclease